MAQEIERARRKMRETEEQLKRWMDGRRRELNESRRQLELAAKNEHDKQNRMVLERERLVSQVKVTEEALEVERGSKRKLDAQATQDRQRLAVLEEQVQQLLRKEKSEIAIAQEIERSRALDAEETKKAVYAYERNLGLKFIKRRDTGALEFQFTQIKEAFPEQQYRIQLSVDGVGKYRVVSTTPPIDGLEPLLQKLNANPADIGTFMRAVRAKFVEYRSDATRP